MEQLWAQITHYTERQDRQVLGQLEKIMQSEDFLRGLDEIDTNDENMEEEEMEGEEDGEEEGEEEGELDLDDGEEGEEEMEEGDYLEDEEQYSGEEDIEKYLDE